MQYMNALEAYLLFEDNMMESIFLSIILTSGKREEKL